MILPHDVIARLSQMRFQTRSKKRGHHKGSHQSAQFGSSLDFSDFREYTPGDDVRQIDWNVYGRTEKHFIKRFLDEQEMRIHVLLDSSLSMQLPQKWLFARQLVAALGCIALSRDDFFSFSYPSDDRVKSFRGKGTRARHALLQQLEELQQVRYSKPFTDEAFRVVPPGCTMLFIVTDGYEQLASWQNCLQHMPKFARDIRFLCIQQADERQPSVRGDFELYDVETTGSVNVTLSDHEIMAYRTRYEKHFQQLQQLCRQRGVLYSEVLAEDAITKVMLQTLRQAGWVM